MMAVDGHGEADARSNGLLHRLRAEWGRPTWVLLKRLALAAAWLILLVCLPFYGFLWESPGAGRVWAAGGGLFSALWDASAATPAGAVVTLTALAILLRRYVWLRMSNKGLVEIINIRTDYMNFFEKKLNDDAVKSLWSGSNDPLSEDKYKIITDCINELLAKLCTRVVLSFEIITNNTCSSTIKLLDPETMQVSTKARDLTQHGRRIKADAILPSYLASENTAFRKILIDGNESYVSNWLHLLYLLGYYHNNNEHWARAYGATVVVPILLDPNKGADKNNILGFLCADNFEGRFPPELAKAILNSYALKVGILLGLLGRIRREEEAT